MVVAKAQISFLATGAGRPVVLVHGLSGSTRWWKYNIPVLAEQFRVYSVDLIGFGGSRGSGRFVLKEAAQYLQSWMNKIGIERASMVGHSMGGHIVAELAADAPERVDRLVLVDAAALPFGYGYAGHLWGLARAVRYLSPAFVPVLASDALRAGPLTLGTAAFELLSADIRQKVAAISAPTLVVWGANDTVVPLILGRQIVDLLPNAHLLVIDRAGHNPMWDRPEPFNQAVVRFLAEGAPPGVNETHI